MNNFKKLYPKKIDLLLLHPNIEIALADFEQIINNDFIQLIGSWMIECHSLFFIISLKT